MAAPSLHHLQSPPASLKLAASWSQILSEDMEAYHCPHACLNHVGPPPAAGSNSLCPSPEPWVALKHLGVVGQHTHSSCRLATASLCQSFQPALASQHMASAQCHLLLAKQDRAECKETPPKPRRLSISAGTSDCQPSLERDAQQAALCQVAFGVVLEGGA